MKRFTANFIQILLIAFLFVLAQIGAAAHEISHINDKTHQTQPDKKSVAEQCAQCVAYAEVAGALTSQTFGLTFVKPTFFTIAYNDLSDYANLQTDYLARAPPQLNHI
jgi:hypothetical protein